MHGARCFGYWVPGAAACSAGLPFHPLVRPAWPPLRAAGLNQRDLLEGINHLATARFMHVIAPHPETGGRAAPLSAGVEKLLPASCFSPAQACAGTCTHKKEQVLRQKGTHLNFQHQKLTR